MNKTSQSSSIEHSEKQPPHNQPKRHDSSREAEDKLKLDTHDTLHSSRRCHGECAEILERTGFESQSPPLQSSHDPAGLFLNKSTTLVPQKSPIIRPPAVDTHKNQYVFSDGNKHEFIKADTEHNAWNELYWKHRDISRFELKRIDTIMADTHRSDKEVWHLNQLHKANNCNNCAHLTTYKCEIHNYHLPYPGIDCEQWEYRGKKA